MKTKEKILEASIQLFNKNGLTQVRLQHIADAVGISVGNLAYHYHSKEAIVMAIDDNLHTLIQPIIVADISLPTLMDFDTHLARYYHLLASHSFYFVDFLEIKRTYSKTYQKLNAYSDLIVSQVDNWLRTHQEKGLLIEEPREGHYKIIAHTIWMIITFYLSRPMEKAVPEDGERIFKEVIWSQILPYLSEVGRIEFDLTVERLLDSFI